MEPITKADLKDLFAELRGVVKRSITESIAEGFATWKPAVGAQASGLQVAVDLPQQHDYRDKGNDAEEVSAVDPLDPSALQASTEPPMAIVDVIPVFAAAAASDGTFDEEAIKVCASATPIPTTEEPLTVDPAVPVTTISMAPSTCSMECPSCDAAAPTLAAAPTSPTATISFTSVPAVAAGHGMLDCKPVIGAAFTADRSLVTAAVPSDTTAVVHALCSIDCATQVVTTPSPMPATTTPTLLWTSPSERITNFRCRGRLLRPMPWPSFRAGELTAAENRPMPWPSFRICAAIEFPILDAYVMVRSLELKLLPNGFTYITLLTVSLDSGTCAALSWEYLGVDYIDCVGSWFFAGCLLVERRKYSAQSSTHYLTACDSVSRLLCTMNCSQLKRLVTAAGHRMMVASFPKGRKNSHMLLPSSVWGQEELHLGFQFQLHSILPDWYLGNHSMMARVCTDYSLKYNSFADTWRSWFLCVRSVCATVDAVVLPDGQRSGNWHSVQPGIARDELLFIIQSAVLNYMEYWWVRTVILTDIVSIFSAWLPVQMEMPHMQQLKWFSISVFSVSTLLSEPVITESQQRNLLNCYQVSKIHPAAMLELQGSTYNLCASETCRVCKIPSYRKYFYSGHYQGEAYFHVGHLSYHVVKHNIPDASCCSGEEHSQEPFLKQECVDVSFNSSFHMCTGMRMKKSEGSGELSQWLANNLWGAYQIWLVAWTVDVFELPTNCGQAPFQGGRDVIRAAFSDQVRFSHDSYNDLNQAFYFDTVSTDLIYYSEDGPGDSSKSNEHHMPWDLGKLVPRDHRKLRLEVKPSFKEGGVLASLPVYPILGCYEGLAPMGRAQILAWLLIQGRRQWNGHPVGSRTRHGNTARRLPHHHCNSPY